MGVSGILPFFFLGFLMVLPLVTWQRQGRGREGLYDVVLDNMLVIPLFLDAVWRLDIGQ